MKDWFIDLYWQSCQYPWHLFVNISLALLLYVLAAKFGSPARFLIARFRKTSAEKKESFFLRLLDIAIFYLLASLVIFFLLLPVLLFKGIGFNFLGYSFYFWFLFFPLDCTVSLIRGKCTKASRFFITVSSIALLLIFAASLFWFPNHIVKKHLVFKTSKIKEPVRIVHLSDLHCENYGVREKRLAEIVNDLKPDIVAISGDIFIMPYEFNTRGFSAAVKILDQLRPRLGIFIVEGHHDFGKAHHLVDALPGKMKLLDAEWIHFNDLKINLSIVGFSPSGKLFDYHEGKDKGNFRIFLAHSPSLIICLRRSDFDLALFGHTHGGQVYIPVVTRLILGKYIHGLYQVGQTPIYVNSGIGLEGFLAPRTRWLTYPEVVTIDLLPEN